MSLFLTDRPEVPPDQQNYLIALDWLRRNGKLPGKGAFDTAVNHDDWCGIFDGRACDCEPEIAINGRRQSYPKSILKGRTRRYGQRK